MAIQTVNIGTTPNDGTGDPARTAFTKLNDNFTQEENAASKLVATNAEALAGTAGVLPDAAGVHAAFKQFGLGVQNLPVYVAGTLDTLTETRFWHVNSAQATADSFPGNTGGELFVIGGVTNGAYAKQFYFPVTNNLNEFYTRTRNNNVWSAWLELFHTGNMQPDLANGLNSPRLMLNASGSTVDNQGDIAGSGLRFCKFNSSGIIGFAGADGIGTWRNVTGLGIGNNEFGLFVRIA